MTPVALALVQSKVSVPDDLLVISDGEQVQGDAALAARDAARDRVHVHTAGVGSNAGGRVPTRAAPGSDYLRNAFGREVISRLDERVLRDTARAGQGLGALQHRRRQRSLPRVASEEVSV